MQQSNKTYTIFCPGDSDNSVDNYLLLPVDGIGFVVIKQSINIGGE